MLKSALRVRVLGGRNIRLTGRLQASTTDKESVNILLLGQLLAVLLVDTATVEDSCLVSSLLADLVLQPRADSSVDLLCLLLGSNLAGANGPDGLVGDDNVGPVGADAALERLELLCDDRDGASCLALLQRLAAAPDDSNTVLAGELCLGRHELVALAKDGSPLGVAENRPGDVAISQLGRRNLAGVGALGLVEDILGSNLDARLQVLTDQKQVEVRRSNDNL